MEGSTGFRRRGECLANTGQPSSDSRAARACENVGMSHIVYKIETERETDGPWIAEIVDVPGVMAYGATEKEAMASAQALALRVLADRIEQEKEPTETVTVSIEAV